MDLLTVRHLDFTMYVECTKFDGIWNKAKRNVGEENLMSAYTWSEGVESVDINALDSVGEFVNISDGLFITAMSKEGMELNLMPTKLSKDPIEINGSTVIVIPIFINQQPLDWVISLV